MKKLFSLLAAVLMAGSMMAGVLVSFNGEAELPAGVKISGTTVKATVTNYNCLQFKNGYTSSGAYNGNAIILNAEGGFKAGDTLTISGFINNKDVTKYAQVQLFTVNAENACSVVWTSDSLVNNYTDAEMTIPVQSYVLESDMDSLMLGRLGGTGANLKYISVVRPEGAPQPTINYWLVGPAAENGWDQTKAMPMAGDSIVRHLAAGTYAFKVLTQEASWTGALGAADVNATASSANWYGDDNVNFELENEGDVTIKVVEGQIVVLGTFKKQETYDYYIKYAGNNWTWVGMTKAPSGVYMHEGVWGGTGANVNTSMSDNGAAWYPEADIKFINDESEELPVPAIGTKGIYGYELGETPTLYFVYDGTPAPKWDGTVTLSKTTIKSVADLNGVTLTFNGATKVEFLGGDADIIALQNKDGSEMYAAWHPEYGGSYTIEGNVVTLTGWFDVTEEAPLPKQNATLYVEDYGTFKIDGKADYFETAEVAFEAAAVTTYNVNYSVVGNVEDETSATGMWLSPDYENTGMFVAGDNTVEEGNYVQVVVYYIEGYSAEVKVNNSVVALDPMGLGLGWRDSITADMTIVVTFTKEEGGETISEVLKYSKFTQDDATATSYQNYTYVTTNGATYKAHMMYQATKDSIQLRSTQTSGTSYYSGIVNTTAPAGMYVKSISVEWDAATSDTRQLNIFTVDAPIAINDMFAKDAKPNYTTIKSEGDKKIDVEGQHAYVGFCSQAGAMFIKSITIEWAKSTTTGLQNNTVVKAVKTLENGKVVITRDGVRYNIMGVKF